MIAIRNTLYNTTPITLHAPGRDELIRRLAQSLPKCKYQVSNDLTIFTWNNRREKSFFEKMFDNFDISYQVLGKDRRKWVNRYKIPLVVEFLQKVTTKYIMGIDADDVLFLDNPQKILDYFVNCKYKLLFNASIINYPLIERHVQPVVDGKVFRYLNSGVWIGETELARQFFGDWKSVKELVAEDFEQADDVIKQHIAISDQVFLKHLLPKHPEVGLDSKCEVFQVFNGASEKWVNFESQ